MLVSMVLWIKYALMGGGAFDFDWSSSTSLLLPLPLWALVMLHGMLGFCMAMSRYWQVLRISFLYSQLFLCNFTQYATDDFFLVWCFYGVYWVDLMLVFDSSEIINLV
jgi:hypothetical protein